MLCWFQYSYCVRMTEMWCRYRKCRRKPGVRLDSIMSPKALFFDRPHRWCWCCVPSCSVDFQTAAASSRQTGGRVGIIDVDRSDKCRWGCWDWIRIRFSDWVLWRRPSLKFWNTMPSARFRRRFLRCARWQSTPARGHIMPYTLG